MCITGIVIVLNVLSNSRRLAGAGALIWMAALIRGSS